MQVNFSNTPFKGTYRFHYGDTNKGLNELGKFQDIKFFCRVHGIEHNSLTENCFDRQKYPEFKNARIVSQISVNDSMDKDVEVFCNVMGINFDKIV